MIGEIRPKGPNQLDERVPIEVGTIQIGSLEAPKAEPVTIGISPTGRVGVWLSHQTSHHVLRFQERNSVWQGDLLQGCFDLENCICLDEEFYRDLCRCHV